MSDRLDKHEAACEKASRPRPAYDMRRKMFPHQEYDNIRSNSTCKRKEFKIIHPVTRWQKQHMDVLNNISFARKLDNLERAGLDISMLRPPPKLHEEYIQCPHCYRKYAPIAAERHIPKCKDIVHKPKPPPGFNSETNIHFPTLTKTDSGKVTVLQKKQTFGQNKSNSQLASLNTTEFREDVEADIFQRCLSPIIRNSIRIIHPDRSRSTQKHSTTSTMNTVRASHSSTKKFEKAAQLSKVDCPHCSRSFAPRAAERHIEICEKVLNKPKSLKVSETSSLTPAKNMTPLSNIHKRIANQLEKQSISREPSTGRILRLEQSFKILKKEAERCERCLSFLPDKARYCMMCGNARC
jgi:hypothetical protein